jgi:hypothetical protein
MTKVPNSDKRITEDKCQSIYMNLLALRENKDGLLSSQWVREFEQTSRCDGFVSFKELRQEYRDHAGNDTIKRVLAYEDDAHADQKRVDQAVLHYFDWHQKQLVSALTWPNYFKYQILFKHERLLTWLGLAGSVGAGWVIVRNSERRRHLWAHQTTERLVKDETRAIKDHVFLRVSLLLHDAHSARPPSAICAPQSPHSTLGARRLCKSHLRRPLRTVRSQSAAPVQCCCCCGRCTRFVWGRNVVTFSVRGRKGERERRRATI